MPRIVPLFVAAMFIIVPLLMLGSCVWNYKLYQDCRADGHKSYECQAMLSQNSRGIVVDDISDHN